MRIFDNLQDMLKAVIRYYTENGYYYVQIVDYPFKKEGKWNQIDTKLTKKFGLHLNKGQRAYRKRKKLSNFAGLRYKNLCLILHTKGYYDLENEHFVDMRSSSVLLNVGSVVKIELSIENDTGSIKFNKRSYQDMKEIVKQIASNPKTWQHKTELEKIKRLPAVRRKMHIQKEHLFELYKKECKKHNRKAFML
jgi:hypothetical protein